MTPAASAAPAAAISVPHFVEISRCTASIVAPPLDLPGQNRDAGRDRIRITDRVACRRRIRRHVLDEVAGDVALRNGLGAGAGVAVPADDVEGGEVDHGYDVVAGA